MPGSHKEARTVTLKPHTTHFAVAESGAACQAANWCPRTPAEKTAIRLRASN